MTAASFRNGIYYIETAFLSPPGFLRLDGSDARPVVRGFTGSTLEQWQLHEATGSIQNVLFANYVSVPDLDMTTTAVSDWEFLHIGDSYAITCCFGTAWTVNLTDSVVVRLADLNFANPVGQLWNITAVGSLTPSQSTSLLGASSTSIAIGVANTSTPTSFPNVSQSTSTAGVNAGGNQTIALTVGLGVGLGVLAIAIVFLVIYFAIRKVPGKPMNPIFDPNNPTWGIWPRNDQMTNDQTTNHEYRRWRVRLKIGWR